MFGVGVILSSLRGTGLWSWLDRLGKLSSAYASLNQINGEELNLVSRRIDISIRTQFTSLAKLTEHELSVAIIVNFFRRFLVSSVSSS